MHINKFSFTLRMVNITGQLVPSEQFMDVQLDDHHHWQHLPDARLRLHELSTNKFHASISTPF